MKIKLIALDLDGTTLCNDHQTIPPENIATIQKAAEHGICMVIATGRVLSRVPQELLSMPAFRYALTSNGAAVIDLRTQMQIYHNPIPEKTIREVLQAVEDLPCYIELYTNGVACVPELSLPLIDHFTLSETRKDFLRSGTRLVCSFEELLTDPNAYVEKINFPFLFPEDYEQVWGRLRQIQQISITSSIVGNAEVNAKDTNKGNGLSHLCAQLGISPQEVLTIGDNGNDLEMLQFSAFSAVPENGTAEARALASHIVASNEQGGVAQAIHTIALSGYGIPHHFPQNTAINHKFF